ncbi:MAG: penicillin-binding protein activator [Desulfuromonadaceae bacterium]|nr:penicillin-binding protein activator [Desulfuromonadaceae bacterium]
MRNLARVTVVLVMWCAGLSLWCGSGAQAEVIASVSESRDDLGPAYRYAQQGQLDDAVSFLRQYLLESADSPRLDEATVLLCQLFIRQGRDEQALLYAERLPDRARDADIRLLLVRDAFARADLSAAAQQLASLDVAHLTADQKRRYLQAEAELSLDRGEALQGLVFLLDALKLVSDDDAETSVFEQLQQLVNQLDDLTADEARFMFAATPVAALMELDRLQRKFELAETEQERQTLIGPLNEILAGAKFFWLQRRAGQLLDLVQPEGWRRRAIGVILPLSGRFAPFGELVRQGLELARQHFPQQDVSWIYVDSRGDAGLAPQLVRQLALGQRVQAIIGPLIGEVAEPAVETAQQLQVPILTLSHWPGLPQRGSCVFRHALTAAQQAEVLADYAIEQLGLNSYAILQPKTAAGNEAARLFAAAIERRGGDVEYWQSYDAEDTDFRRPLLALRGLDARIERTDEEEAEIEAARVALRDQGLPTVDFEGLFIPDFADRVALIAPQLAYYGVENVQLLGTSGWNAALLQEQAGRYVRNAVICDGFFIDADEPAVQRFVRDYQQRYGEAPTILEAQAYDCASFLLALLGNEASRSGQSLCQLFPRAVGFDGVSGLQGFDGRGEAQRTLSLLRVTRSGFELIGESMVAPLEAATTALPASRH